MSSDAVAAVDLGATSGRVVLGRVGPGRLEVEDVHRFPNLPVRTRDGLHWNILELYRNVLEGLRKAVAAEPGLVSIGIDSWGVDYALLRHGRVVGPVEATATGNILVRGRAAGLLSGTLEDLRDLVARSTRPAEYVPAAPTSR
jgi:hypothetical protein